VRRGCLVPLGPTRLDWPEAAWTGGIMIPMRKRRLIPVLGVAAVLLGCGIFEQWPRPPRFTVESIGECYNLDFDGETRVSREQVEATIGPPGDYRTGPTQFRTSRIYWAPNYTWQVEKPLYVLVWQNDDDTLRIGFNYSGQAVMHREEFTERIEQTSFDNLLWRARRQWHRWFPE
jgi:hypothetical protein